MLSLALACGLFAADPVPSTQDPALAIKVLQARIATLNARIAQLQDQLAVMGAALNAAQDHSAKAVQQSQQAEQAAIEQAGKDLKCPSGLDLDTLACKPAAHDEDKAPQPPVKPL
jgi:TolA-binding protein